MKDPYMRPEEEEAAAAKDGYVKFVKAVADLAREHGVHPGDPHDFDFILTDDDEMTKYEVNLDPYYIDPDGNPTIIVVDIDKEDSKVLRMVISSYWSDDDPQVESEVKPFDTEETELLDVPNLGYILKNSLEGHYRANHTKQAPNVIFEPRVPEGLTH